MKVKVFILVLAGLFLMSSVSAQWYNSPQEINLNAQDDESGVENTFYCIDQEDNCQPRDDGQEYEDPFMLEQEGINYVRYNSRDHVGNIEETHSKTVRIDETDPETTDDYPGGWQNTSVTVDLSCNDPENPDASGCDTTEYCTGQSCTPGTEGKSISFDTEGTHYLRYRSTDVAGNTEDIHTTEVKLDFTDPNILVQKEASGEGSESRNATVSCTDEMSGCDESTLQIYESETAAFQCPEGLDRYEHGSTYEVDQHLWVCAAGKDRAGNYDDSEEPVEFSIGTLTTELTYPGKPGVVFTSIDSSIPVMLDVGNEQDNTRTINVSVSGANAELSEGGTSKEVTLNGVEDERFNIMARPEEPGNTTLDISIRDETEGFTLNREVKIQTRDTGARTSSSGRQVPGLGPVHVMALMLMASSYYWISMRN